MTPEKENVRRLQACLKACDAIPTDELVPAGFAANDNQPRQEAI